MKSPLLLLLALGAPLAFAQAPIPEPELPPGLADQPVVLNQTAPLASLETQVRSAGFDQRGAYATAFDEVNRAVETKVSELRSRGLIFADEAETNLAVAREQGRQTFRDLSLTTEETWQTARDNAVSAMRRLRGALEDLEETATLPPA
jgi:hypothetical protein